MSLQSRLFTVSYQNAEKVAAPDVVKGLRTAWDWTKDNVPHTMPEVREFWNKHQNDILMGLTTAGVMGGAYGLTAAKRPYETEEEFRRRRAGGIAQSALLGGAMGTAAFPLARWIKGTPELDVTGKPVKKPDGTPKMNGLPAVIDKVMDATDPEKEKVLPGSAGPVTSGTSPADIWDQTIREGPQYAGAAAGAYGGWRAGAAANNHWEKDWSAIHSTEHGHEKAIKDLLDRNPALRDKVPNYGGRNVERWRVLTTRPPVPQAQPGWILPHFDSARGKVVSPSWVPKRLGGGEHKVPGLARAHAYLEPYATYDVVGPKVDPHGLAGAQGVNLEGKSKTLNEIANEIASHDRGVRGTPTRIAQGVGRNARRVGLRGGGGILGAIGGSALFDTIANKMEDSWRRSALGQGLPQLKSEYAKTQPGYKAPDRLWQMIYQNTLGKPVDAVGSVASEAARMSNPLNWFRHKEVPGQVAPAPAAPSTSVPPTGPVATPVPVSIEPTLKPAPFATQ